MDQEGKGIDIGEHPGAVREMAQRFASMGWVRVPRLGVPPQCRAKVQLEAELLQNPRRAQRRAGGVLSQGMTNMADAGAQERARTDDVLFVDFHAGAASAGLREQLRGLFKLDQIIERVVCQLATQLRGPPLGLCLRGRSKMMFARYEPGGFYLPHVDADEGDDRVLTAVYYLNQDWRREDGGALRLLPPGGQPVDIWPEEDTLALFRADEMVHEVRSARARRLAVTIWFRGVCGEVQADVNGALQRTVPLRRLPESLQPSLAVKGVASPRQPGAERWHSAGQFGAEQAGAARPALKCQADSSDSSDDSRGGAAERGPLLVCWNIVGFRLRQGAEKFAGLFVAARRLGVRDHVVVSYPEDHGVEGEGPGKWAEYVDRLVEAIDRKPRRAGRPLLLWAHSVASAGALTVAWRLGARVLKVYLVDGNAPAPGGPDLWAHTNAMFRSWSDEHWIVMLAAWNSGSTVLQEMAAAVLTGWDASRSRGAQDVLSHGKRQYINAIHPDLGRDLGVIPAPIFAFSMLRDEVVPLEAVRNARWWTSAGFHLETFDATHMGWLEPSADPGACARRCGVFDRVCEDIGANLEGWKRSCQAKTPGGC